MNRHERRAAARKSQTARNGTDGDTPDALCEAGLRHMSAGRYLDAQRCCQRALALDAGRADTLQLMGLLSLHAKQYDAAIEWVGRANQADPATPYLASLGAALEQQGLLDEALKAFNQATQFKPGDAELWTKLANVLVPLLRFDHAIWAYEQALKLAPRYWYAVYNYAVLLLRTERFEEALIKFNLCDEMQPNHAATLNKRGEALYKLDRFDEALSDSKQAQALDPTNADICNSIGAALQKLARHEEALQWFDRSLDLQPDFVAALNNKASSLGEVLRLDEAIKVYRNAKRLDPENAETDWNLALLQLLNGNFESGWRGREARWKVPSLGAAATYPKFPQPVWLGEGVIEGKTILVCADEGMGDTIQFVRYLPMLAALGARVILLPQEPLYPLLSGLAGVSQCLPNLRQGVPAFDNHCPITSLPLAFRTTLETVPAPTSYLPTPSYDRRQIWEGRLGRHDRLRVGLVCSGNPKHKNDRNRSIPLRMLARILDADATFVSLQKDARPEDKAMLLEQAQIVDLSDHLTDFAETSALVSCLDLVITVDTSVAHLAGALGRTTWILLPYTPDWRWLLDRDDSPWYPTVRLFRQSETREYESVLDRVRSELMVLIEDWKHRSMQSITPKY
jgi:tetratricopeptide (TPR) repeat protein